jgi:hypothetical protein
MTPRLIGKLLKAGAFMTVSLVVCGAAQDREIELPSLAAPVGTNSNKSATIASNASEQKQPLKSLPTTPVQEILKMADAGISKEVIKVYVETAPLSYNPSAAEIIALKQHGIPDDITTAFLKRTAEVRPQNSQAKETRPPPASVVHHDNRSYLDPEGYDYFQYYYLYPRTLATAYERLGPYPSPYSPGYYGAFGPYYPYGHRFGSRQWFSP